MAKMEEDKSFLQQKFKNQKNVDTSVRQSHTFYGYLSGKIKNMHTKDYAIDDPNSEILLNQAQFYLKDSQKCFQQKSLELFFHKKFTAKDLQKSIKLYTQDGQTKFVKYSAYAVNNTDAFIKRFNVGKQEAYGCCLAMAYYTGDESQRVSRSCSIIIKLYVKQQANSIQNTAQYEAMRCIGQWLFKTLNYIPLHWGKVTRCINLQPEQQGLYTRGNIVSWLQFSSSSYAQTTAYFEKRNSRFIIYSLSGRCIQQFSIYQKSQSQVLFKPYSHFIVLKTQKVDGKFLIYMRQIFIGQSTKNILWVDDNIFDSKWENKKYMEKALIKQPLLGIIPKVSTECALAYLNCQLGKEVRKENNNNSLRIISDMTRTNESSSHNAGARFAKECQKLKMENKMIIFNSNKEKGEQHLKQLGVQLKQLRVTVSVQDVLQFMKFS